MQHGDTAPLRLRVQVYPGRRLEVRTLEHPSKRVVLSDIALEGNVQIIREREWLMVDHLLGGSYGIPVEADPKSSVPSPNLRDAWDEEQVDVWKIAPDGTEEELFQ